MTYRGLPAGMEMDDKEGNGPTAVPTLIGFVAAAVLLALFFLLE